MDSLAQDGRPERVETDGKSEEQGKDYVLDDPTGGVSLLVDSGIKFHIRAKCICLFTSAGLGAGQIKQKSAT